MPSYARYGRFQRLKRGLEVHVGTGEYFDRHTTGKLHSLGVAGPVRSGNDDLIAIVEQDLEGFIHGLLAAVGHHHLFRLHLVAGITQRLAGNGLAQFRQTRCGRVLVVRRVHHSRRRSLHNRLGGGEVRFANTEADDVNALRLHGLGLHVDGQSGARRDLVDAVGKWESRLICRHGSMLLPNTNNMPPVQDRCAGI